MKEKSFLIIKQGLGIGGTETLTMRMCNWLVENGCFVTLLTEPGEEHITSGLSLDVKTIRYPKNFWNLTRVANASELIKSNKLQNVNYIYGYGPIDLFVSLAVAQILTSAIPLIGVYHPHSYEKFKPSHVLRKLGQCLLLSLPENNIFFMNKAVRLSHEKILKYRFKKPVTWPLPVYVPNYKKTQNRSNKIVSIGNLKNFKTYNLTMVEVVKNLREKGYDVEYEIYGEGPSRPIIEERIMAFNLQKHVHLKGQIAYEKYHDTVRRGFVFVGLGTALLEAAAAGVPAIATVAYSTKPVSFGFVHELPEYGVGEPVDNYPYKHIQDLVEEAYCAAPWDYNNMRKKGYNFVRDNYALDNIMKSFLEKIMFAEPLSASNYQRLLYITFWASRWFLGKRWVKQLLKEYLMTNKRNQPSLSQKV